MASISRENAHVFAYILWQRHVFLVTFRLVTGTIHQNTGQNAPPEGARDNKEQADWQ
jgi:hypothetical protein